MDDEDDFYADEYEDEAQPVAETAEHLDSVDDFYADEDESHALAADDFLAAEEAEDEEEKPVVYEVFNPDQTVGVVCDRDGTIVGIHLDDEILPQGDDYVAEQVRRIAALAHQKSRVGLRSEMESNGTDAFTLSSFGLPTEKEYVAMEAAEFGTLPKPKE